MGVVHENTTPELYQKHLIYSITKNHIETCGNDQKNHIETYWIPQFIDLYFNNINTEYTHVYIENN